MSNDIYELELICENCKLKVFYSFKKGVPFTYDNQICKYCGCYELQFTGERKE